MQLANNITLSVYKAAYESAQPGMTNRQFSQLIDAAYSRCGVTGDASCQVGEYSALPHGSLQPQVIREGEIILIDDGCTVEGYQSDITRTFVLGKPSDKMKKVFDIVHRAQSDTSLPVEVLRRFAQRFQSQEWPGGRLPALYYDPRSLETDAQAHPLIVRQAQDIIEELIFIVPLPHVIAENTGRGALGPDGPSPTATAVPRMPGDRCCRRA